MNFSKLHKCFMIVVIHIDGEVETSFQLSQSRVNPGNGSHLQSQNVRLDKNNGIVEVNTCTM